MAEQIKNSPADTANFFKEGGETASDDDDDEKLIPAHIFDESENKKFDCAENKDNAVKKEDEFRRDLLSPDGAREKDLASPLPFFKFIIMRHRMECCISFALCIVVFASFFHAHYALKGRLAQRKAPAPSRFFWINSAVLDFYDGNGFDAHRLLAAQRDRNASLGVIFVMFYAPWSARSQEARWHMDALARHFYPNNFDVEETKNGSKLTQGPVHFVAVNCWEPNGHCRRSYRLYSYPVFFAYAGTENPIYYNGVVSADYMFKFLENLLSPFVRLLNQDDLRNFLAQRTTLCIGYFDFSAQQNTTRYDQFYVASLKALESDPLRSAVKFAVITESDLANMLNFTFNGQLKLFRWMNDTVIDYPENVEYVPKSIISWIFENLGNTIRWISPSMGGGGKSDALHEYMTRKPTLILFAPRQPLLGFSPYYDALTDVSLRYYDCPTNEPLYPGRLALTINHLYQRQEEAKDTWRHLTEYCLRTLKEETRLLTDCCEDISSLERRTLYERQHHKNVCDVCVEKDKKCHRENLFRFSPCERFFTSDYLPDSFSVAAKIFLTPFFASRTCDRLINEFRLPKSSVIDYCCEEDDGKKTLRKSTFFRSRKYIFKGDFKENTFYGKNTYGKNTFGIISKSDCEKLRLARLLHYQQMWNEENISKEDLKKNRKLGENVPWSGLACQTNRTLQFAAMDKNFYAIFATKLGILKMDLLTPAAAIFDNENEAVFVLENVSDSRQLGEFIVNFTRHKLTRFYRSANNKDYYGPNTNFPDSNTTCNSSICIRSLTSATLHQVVDNNRKDTVIFYTAPWCGACQRLFHVYQTVAYYFRAVEDHVSFVQLDISNNDLQWHYTVDSVPALLYFPASRSSESVSFPPYAPWELPNLIAFILANMDRDTRLRFAISTCLSATNFKKNNRCLARNRLRAKRELSNIRRRSRSARLELERAIRFPVEEIDLNLYRVYLQRLWQEIGRNELRKRALNALLTDALRADFLHANSTLTNKHSLSRFYT